MLLFWAVGIAGIAVGLAAGQVVMVWRRRSYKLPPEIVNHIAKAIAAQHDDVQMFVVPGEALPDAERVLVQRILAALQEPVPTQEEWWWEDWHPSRHWAGRPDKEIN